MFFGDFIQRPRRTQKAITRATWTTRRMTSIPSCRPTADQIDNRANGPTFYDTTGKPNASMASPRVTEGADQGRDRGSRPPVCSRQ